MLDKQTLNLDRNKTVIFKEILIRTVTFTVSSGNCN